MHNNLSCSRKHLYVQSSVLADVVTTVSPGVLGTHVDGMVWATLYALRYTQKHGPK